MSLVSLTCNFKAEKQAQKPVCHMISHVHKAVGQCVAVRRVRLLLACKYALRLRGACETWLVVARAKRCGAVWERSMPVWINVQCHLWNGSKPPRWTLLTPWAMSQLPQERPVKGLQSQLMLISSCQINFLPFHGSNIYDIRLCMCYAVTRIHLIIYIHCAHLYTLRNASAV